MLSDYKSERAVFKEMTITKMRGIDSRGLSGGLQNVEILFGFGFYEYRQRRGFICSS